MARPPRLQFPGAIYHIVARGDGRKVIFHDGEHYQRLTQGLAAEVQRSGWEVLAYCWMPSHIHLLVRTPEPNLSRGMQHWLSGYANWYAKRNCRPGHLFQGRFKSFLVENDSYFWVLSRYIHLNPCRGNRPLAKKPDGWAHSSYLGYARRARRCPFVQYETLLDAWQGEYGATDAAEAYRRFVQAGLSGVIDDPLKSARSQWIVGTEAFLKRMAAMADGQQGRKRGVISRRMRAYLPKEILRLVAEHHRVDPADYVGFRATAPGRELAALFCRRYTGCSLAELSKTFGLSHPDSSANLIRRAQRREKSSPRFRRQIAEIEAILAPKTENQV